MSTDLGLKSPASAAAVADSTTSCATSFAADLRCVTRFLLPRDVSTTLIHPGSSFRLGTALLAWVPCHSPAASSFARFVRILAD